MINRKNLGIPSFNKTSLSITDDDEMQKIKFPRTFNFNLGIS